jgi:hypothetical protein
MKGALDSFPRLSELMQSIGLETNPHARFYQVNTTI